VKQIFLSAHPSVRALALPALVAGFVAEVGENDTSVNLLAVEVTTPGPEVGETYLVGRPTGRFYNGLPWWEARRETS
jgi:hypothetical protein